jgi:GT2 family glycosyltransferase/Flp pilus assembly protein TadD
MKTVLALIDHPNLDLIIGPVLIKLRERGINTLVLVAGAGRADYLDMAGIPYQKKMNLQTDFFSIGGKKLFLNAADLAYAAHKHGRRLVEMCRAQGIPSLALEHGTFFNVQMYESDLFVSDKMAIIGDIEYEEYKKLGVASERLVITGFPPFDEFYTYTQNNPFRQGDYIFIAGQNHGLVNEDKSLGHRQVIELLKKLYRLLHISFPDLPIVIKPHPAEPFHGTVKLYTDAIDKDMQDSIKVIRGKNENVSLIANSAFVVSFSPSVLFESILLKKAALGINIYTVADCFHESEAFGVEILNTDHSSIIRDVSSQLEKHLEKVKPLISQPLKVTEGFFEKYLYKFDGRAAERVADTAMQMMDEITYSENYFEKEILLPVFKEIGYERYQRLMGIAEEARLKDRDNFTILDVGGFDNALRKFIPGARYSSYNGFITGTQRAPYDVNAFDVVVAADVIEHVQPGDREAFLFELLRIAKQRVVFSFPTPEARLFEDFILTIMPEHKWLREHHTVGLPARENVDGILNTAGVSYTVKTNHNLASWIYSVIFDHLNIKQDVKQRVNEFLQKQCFVTDQGSPAYRYIYTVDIPEGLDKQTLCKQRDGILVQPGTPKVSIIIPVFNKSEYTRKCLDALSRTTQAELYELVIIDNGSTDDTCEILKKLPGNARVISNKKNQGFARACNQGALAAAGEYILFLNNDTEPKPGWLEPLIRVLDTKQSAAATGSKLLFPDGTIQHAGVITFDDKKLPDPLVARHIYYQKPGDFPDANRMRTYQALTAACLLVRKSAFEDVDGFDEGYWNGYEDIDLCFKLKMKGWELVYQPESEVIHHESKSGRERFSRVPDNIKRLHSRWLGKVNPDFIIEKDGSVRKYDKTAGSCPDPGLSQSGVADNYFPNPVQKGLVSIVILTFNQLKYTRECIESLMRHTPEPHEIIFVDNGSTDGTVKWLRALVQEHQNCKLIENPKNLGFSKGCNQGIRASAGEYILLLNNDVILAAGWLSGMLACHSSAPDTGIVGPMTNNISGIQKIRDNGYSRERLDEYAAKFREANFRRRVYSRRIVGFCMLFTREVIEKTGLLDESFGTGNYEDDDLCLRVTLEGYRNVIAGDVFIHHYGSRSFAGNRIDYGSAMAGNKKLFSGKWSGDITSPAGKKLISLKALERADYLNQTGLHEKAVGKFLEAIKHSPCDRNIYLSFSSMLISLKQFRNALDVLNEMPKDKDDPESFALTGYCKDGIELSDEAAEYLERALALDGASALAMNLKGILFYKKGMREDAEQCFRAAMGYDPGYGEPYTNLGVLKWSEDAGEDALAFLEKGFILSPNVPDIAEAYHASSASLGVFSRAESTFRDAKALYPFNRRIAFLLIDILIRHGKIADALQEIQEAIIIYGTDEGMINAALELRKRLDEQAEGDVNKKPAVSLCMIVKNEEKNLPRCLVSLKSLVDEMIVVNTGSADRTGDIARIYGANVYDLEWKNDFSEARNYSLSKATGDWILVLDADEVISPADHHVIAGIVNKKGGKRAAYSFTTRNYINDMTMTGWTANGGLYPEEEAGSGWYPSRKVRLFPHDNRIRFENPVHELVENSLRGTGITIKEINIPIHHYGKLSRDRVISKGEDYYNLGKVKVEESGGDLQSIFELAVQATELGRYEEAAELWQNLLDLKMPVPPAYLTRAYLNLGGVYLQLGKYSDALLISKKAFKLNPGIKEAVINYALAEFCAGEMNNAIAVLENLTGRVSGYPPALALLAAAYSVESRKERGSECFTELSKTGVSPVVYILDYAKKLIAAGRKEQAIALLSAAVGFDILNKEILELLAACCKGSDNCEQTAAG